MVRSLICFVPPITFAFEASFHYEHNNIARRMSILAALDRQAHNRSVAGTGFQGSMHHSVAARPHERACGLQ
jgi:hypothetical protein